MCRRTHSHTHAHTHIYVYVYYNSAYRTTGCEVLVTDAKNVEKAAQFFTHEVPP
jgi:hypothetical protein